MNGIKKKFLAQLVEINSELLHYHTKELDQKDGILKLCISLLNAGKNSVCVHKLWALGIVLDSKVHPKHRTCTRCCAVKFFCVDSG